MTQTDQKPIVLGPGGQISNVEQNMVLLNLLPKAKVLPSDELLKLATFYKAYPTNVQLGEHLERLAKALREHETREGKLVVTEQVFPEYFAYADKIEDSGEGDKVLGEGSEDESVFTLLYVHRVPFSGIGLLIETLDIRKESGTESFHYIIGVGSAPDSSSNV